MFSRLCSKLSPPILSYGVMNLQTSATAEAARKGTRMRKEAIKKAMKRRKVVEVVQKEYIPANKRRELEKLRMKKDRAGITDVTDDNVYIKNQFKDDGLRITDCAAHFRQFFHPTSYNIPDAPVYVYAELSMKLDRKIRYVPSFTGMLDYPNSFGSNQLRRTILVISEDMKIRDELMSLGVDSIIGTEITKLVKAKQVSMENFTHVICDVEMLPELMALRSILKKKYPTANEGTAVSDVLGTVKRYLSGVEYAVIKNKYDPNFAHIEAQIGDLSMTDDQIEANFNVFIKDVSSKQPKTRTKTIFDSIQLRCPPSTLNPGVDFQHYLAMTR